MTDTEFEYLDTEKMESEALAYQDDKDIYNYLLGCYQRAWTGTKAETVLAMMRASTSQEENQAILQFADLMPESTLPSASD